jgi:hypothetical protein
MAKSLDSKLREVQRLLNSMLEDSGETADNAPSHWELPVLPPPDPEGRLSSTDLLSWWFRAPQNRAASLHEYLRSAEKVSVDSHSRTAIQSPQPAADSWADLSAVFPEPEEQLAEEHAQAAVDCLYEFLHAVGRSDVESAMALVDDDYHTIQDDVEIDKLKFRTLLEAHLDSLRGWDFEVSLAVAPEPVMHPYAVLISARMQFDAQNRRTGAKKGDIEHRVAVLQQDTSGGWKIRGFAEVDA